LHEVFEVREIGEASVWFWTEVSWHCNVDTVLVVLLHLLVLRQGHSQLLRRSLLGRTLAADYLDIINVVMLLRVLLGIKLGIGINEHRVVLFQTYCADQLSVCSALGSRNRRLKAWVESVLLVGEVAVPLLAQKPRVCIELSILHQQVILFRNVLLRPLHDAGFETKDRQPDMVGDQVRLPR